MTAPSFLAYTGGLAGGGLFRLPSPRATFSLLLKASRQDASLTPALQIGSFNLTAGTAGTNWFGVISRPPLAGFRYNHGIHIAEVIVPTNPPGPRPACSAKALDAARPWVVPSEARALGVGPVGKPFEAQRFVCRDGWALARGAARRQPIALYVQADIRWQRATEASPRNFVSRVGVLAPTPLMRWQMAHAVGLKLRRPRKPSAPGSGTPSSGIGRQNGLGSVQIPVIPGSAVYSGELGFGYGRRPLTRRPCAGCWFAVATQTSRAGTRELASLHIFRLRNGRWAAGGTVTKTITSPRA